MPDPFSRYQQSGLQHSEQETTIANGQPSPTFYDELSALINKHSKEQTSGTPDYILAEYLLGCLDTFEKTIGSRAQWRGERVDSTFDVKYDKKLPIAVPQEDGTHLQIGEAEVSVFPGNSARYGRVVHVTPVFAEPTNG